MIGRRFFKAVVFFLLGLVVGLIAASLLATYLNRPAEDLRYFATAIVGLLGIVVALGTYAHHLAQASSERLWKQTRSQVVLPIELSILTGYAEDCMLVANAYHNRLAQGAPSDTSHSSIDDANVPRISDRSIDRIAEAAADLELEQIGDLLRNYQVQHARLAGMIERYRWPVIGSTDRRPSISEVNMCLRDAARLYLLAGHQFEAARGNWEFKDPSVTQEDIDKCLEFRGFPSGR